MESSCLVGSENQKIFLTFYYIKMLKFDYVVVTRDVCMSSEMCASHSEMCACQVRCVHLIVRCVHLIVRSGNFKGEILWDLGVSCNAELRRCVASKSCFAELCCLAASLSCVAELHHWAELLNFLRALNKEFFASGYRLKSFQSCFKVHFG